MTFVIVPYMVTMYISCIVFGI